MYYMQFKNDDGSWEEFEVQQGHIYCKCHVCGQEFVPFSIEFDKQFASEEERFFWNSCPDCAEKRKAEYRSQERKMAHTKLAEELSRVFRKEMYPGMQLIHISCWTDRTQKKSPWFRWKS